MLVREEYQRVFFRDIVEHVFSCDDKEKALAAVDEYDRFYRGVRGTRGLSGKKSMNSHTQFRSLFVEEEEVDDEEIAAEVTLDESKLDALENSEEM
jgi:hypothetical protein